MGPGAVEQRTGRCFASPGERCTRVRDTPCRFSSTPRLKCALLHYTTDAGAVVVKVILPFLVALLSAGCAIRPLPEQTTGITTFNIVKQIRCETREAVFNTFIKVLADNPQVFGEPARTVAEGFRGHPELMDQLKPALFTGAARDFAGFFWNTGIAYNFSLDMTEINNLDTQIDFIQILTGSTRTLGLSAGLDRQRENTRTFTITDDFAGLLNLKPTTYCDGHLAAGENQIYPMTGKIGVEPFVHEFVRIALFTNLGAKDSGPPTMVDTLQFQTLVSGSAVPKIVFSPVGRGFQLADASLTAQVSRKDVHTLTMGLSVVAPPPAEAAVASKSPLFGRLLTAKGGGTRQSAANAVDQELTRQALSKTVIVRP
jgi:hypothetical protein